MESFFSQLLLLQNIPVLAHPFENRLRTNSASFNLSPLAILRSDFFSHSISACTEQ